jgi:hypothetical protein
MDLDDNDEGQGENQPQVSITFDQSGSSACFLRAMRPDVPFSLEDWWHETISLNHIFLKF